MKVGDKIDPVALGHRDIDVKTMLKEAGYYTGQVSMAKLPTIPQEVQDAISAQTEARKAYGHTAKTMVFTCKACGAKCSAEVKVEGVSGPSCESLAEPYEKALGKVTKAGETHEYYEDSRVDGGVSVGGGQ